MRPFIIASLGIVLVNDVAAAQQKSLKQQLIGTWTLTAFFQECPDGTRSDLLGQNPKGLRIFQADGRMSNIVVRSDLPRFASNKPLEGTADENRAVVQGSYATFYGRYSVDEELGTVTYHIEQSVFANVNGTDQKRSVTVVGDEMRNVAPIGSCTGAMVWKRAD